MSPLVICEILALFVNTLTADHKHSFPNTEFNLFKCNYLRNKKKSKFSLHFLNLHHYLSILKKKMTLIARINPKLRIAKDVVR